VSIFTVLWILWGVYFAVVEGLGLYRESKHLSEDATLSEHIWHWFAVKNPSGPRWWVHTRRVLLVLGMAELTVHFAAGRWWI
jgi:hypothetical protein